MARALLQPLDVIKIRFQLQIEPVSRIEEKAVRSGAKYTSMIQAVNVIWREEGITAFWKGHVPAQYLSILFGICQFWTFEYTTQHLWLRTSMMQEHPTSANLLAGAVAGVSAATACQPFDVIRTRLVAQSDANKVYKSFRHAAHEVLRREGMKGMYRGWVPSLIQITPYASLQFGFYHLTSRVYDQIVLQLHHMDEKPHFSEYPSMAQSFICGNNVVRVTCTLDFIHFQAGGASGLIAKTIIYPLDVIKKRLQVQGFREARRDFGKFRTYHSFTDCIRKIWLDEQIAGFFKGLTPSMLKALLTSACYFGFYEKAVQMLAHRRKEKRLKKRK